MYVKTKDGQIAKHPYEYSDLQAENPSTNFGGQDMYQAFQGTEDNLAGYILEAVTQQEQPQYDSKTQVISLSNTPVSEAGQWVLKWAVRSKTAEELAQQDVEKASAVRSERNNKLYVSDWTQVADAPVDKTAWATYRQAIRDITSQAGFPWTTTWPDAP